MRCRADIFVRIGLFSVCLFWLGVIAAQADRYVATNGLHVTPFTNWSMAASNDIQLAINVATNGDMVWLSNGYYRITNQVAVSNRITVKGFNGYTNTIVYGAFPDYTTRVFYVTSTGVLDGLTISNGYRSGSNNYSGGGGAYITGNGQVKNCYLVNNVCSNYGVAAGGGGAYLSNGIINNCIIINNNSVTNPGGGVYLANVGFISNSVISGNKCDRSPGGGGIYLAGLIGIYPAQIDACRISNNLCTAGAGGGGVLVTNNGQLRNCLINNNTNTAAVGNGGGVFLGNTASFLSTYYGMLNCTIANNYSTNEGGGIAVCGQSNYIVNCIIYSNSSSSNNYPDVYATGNNATSFYYSCATASLAANQGNITNDPMFEDSGSWRLKANSPCVNTGTNQDWMTSCFDLDGRARIRYGTVDMGAYERGHEATMYRFSK